MSSGAVFSRFVLFCILLTASVGATQAEDSIEVVPDRVAQFVSSFCSRCHGPDKQEGDFRLDTLPVSRTAAHAENWQMVLDNLLLGKMPPETEPQPSEFEVEQIADWIRKELSRAAVSLRDARSEVTLRRLNRTEYRNTIADLFDVYGDFTSGFPEDSRAHGFDNNAGALMLSASQMQEYMKAAEFVLARAIAPEKRPEAKRVVFTLHDLNREAAEIARKNLKNRQEKFSNLTPSEQQNTLKMEAKAKANPESFGYRFPVLEEGQYRPPKSDDSNDLDAVMTVQQYFSGEPNTSKRFTIRQPGWYRVRAVAYALKNDSKPVRLKFTAGNAVKGLLPKAQSIFALTDDQPREYEATYYLEPGDRVTFTMLDGAPHAQGREFIDQPGPFIAIRSFSIEGPIYETWPPKGHQTLFGTIDPTDPNPETVDAIVSRLAPTLFRRPVDTVTISKYRDLYAEFLRTMTPQDSLRSVLTTMLISPRFLYHEVPPNEPDAFSIASRMSYLLWRSTPDEELLNAAASGSLLRADARRVQAARMIADERVNRFLTDFTGQWLRVQELGMMRANPDLYPEYDPELELAMRGETEQFLSHMFHRDLPLAQLIDSDWTMLNERLAKHYGIDGVIGSNFRRVELDKSQSVRGGLLTQASIHAVTSNGSTTSPVARGVWVLEKLLGTPPPPPPPDVPAIEPDIRGATTIREQLARHREITACNSCHKKIDPFGFALENFDVIGGWRENYRALSEATNRSRAKIINGPPVQAEGEWIGVGSFSGFQEFRELLKKQEHFVIENVTHQLATFALGRAPGFADKQTLREIAARAGRERAGMRTLLLDFISSPVFANP
jgi:hypothetical protein